MSVSMIWCDWMCIGAMLCSVVLWGCGVLTASVERLSAGITSVCEPVPLSHHPSTGERDMEMDHRRLSALFGDSVEHMTFKSSSTSSSWLFWQRVCVCVCVDFLGYTLGTKLSLDVSLITKDFPLGTSSKVNWLLNNVNSVLFGGRKITNETFNIGVVFSWKALVFYGAQIENFKSSVSHILNKHVSIYAQISQDTKWMQSNISHQMILAALHVQFLALDSVYQ